jgi:hypothetical protein
MKRGNKLVPAPLRLLESPAAALQLEDDLSGEQRQYEEHDENANRDEE